MSNIMFSVYLASRVLGRGHSNLECLRGKVVSTNTSPQEQRSQECATKEIFILDGSKVLNTKQIYGHKFPNFITFLRAELLEWGN
jgi:hypothetical protein